MGARDQLIRDTFVDLADTLASDYDVGEFLQVLVQRCEDVMAVTTCGVLVEDPQGTLRLAAATSRAMHQLEQAEIHLMDGPCFEAYRRVEPIVSRRRSPTWPRSASCRNARSHAPNNAHGNSSTPSTASSSSRPRESSPNAMASV